VILPESERERTPHAPPLSNKHLQVLEEGSAILRDVLEERGVYSTTGGRTLPDGFSQRQRRRGGGILFTVHRPSGETDHCFRPDAPDPDNPGRKYEMRCKKLGAPGNVLDVHPSARHLIGDRRAPVVFAEGIKKADAITSAARRAGAEVLVVAIAGVWNWISEGKPVPDMFDIPMDGRGAYICFDSDVFRNPDVHDAQRRLEEHLTEREARVRVAYLPDQADGSKMGADDYLAGGHTYAELMALMRPYDPETFAAERLTRSALLRLSLENLERRFWAQEWKGMGGHSARDVYKVIVDISEGRGKLHPDGLRVKVSRGELARMAKVSTRTLQKAIERLEEMGLIYRDNDGRKPRERGAFVVRADVNCYGGGRADTRAAQGVESGVTLGSLHLRAPRLRWSSPAFKGRRGVVKGTRRVRLSLAPRPRPAVKRLGKIRGAVLDVLDATGGSASVAGLCEALHRTRPRDLRRRTLPMLEEAYIITVEGDEVTLAADWLQRLEAARELGGEIDAENRARTRSRLKSEAFRNQDKVEPTHHFANDPNADGHMGELSLVDEPGAADEEETPASPLAAAVRDYLDVHPSDACQPPGWIGVTLWAYGLHPKLTNPAAEIRTALEELGGETYLRERLDAAKGAAA
jgi:DNA-binding transcriptional ArsR family regulator